MPSANHRPGDRLRAALATLLVAATAACGSAAPQRSGSPSGSGSAPLAASGPSGLTLPLAPSVQADLAVARRQVANLFSYDYRRLGPYATTVADLTLEPFRTQLLSAGHALLAQSRQHHWSRTATVPAIGVLSDGPTGLVAMAYLDESTTRPGAKPLAEHSTVVVTMERRGAALPVTGLTALGSAAYQAPPSTDAPSGDLRQAITTADADLRAFFTFSPATFDAVYRRFETRSTGRLRQQLVDEHKTLRAAVVAARISSSVDSLQTAVVAAGASTITLITFVAVTQRRPAPQPQYYRVRTTLARSGSGYLVRAATFGS